MKKALLIVDVLKCFGTGGSLEVKRAEEILTFINAQITSGKYDRVVLIQEAHKKGHVSFASTYGLAPFQLIDTGTKMPYIEGQKVMGRLQMIWPDHGDIQATDHTSADFIPGLRVDLADVIIRKGARLDFDSYSGFTDDGGEETGLAGYLLSQSITHVDVVGLATDYCVKATALDARKAHFQTSVLLQGCRGISPEAIAATCQELKAANVQVVE